MIGRQEKEGDCVASKRVVLVLVKGWGENQYVVRALCYESSLEAHVLTEGRLACSLELR